MYDNRIEILQLLFFKSLKAYATPSETVASCLGKENFVYHASPFDYIPIITIYRYFLFVIYEKL